VTDVPLTPYEQRALATIEDRLGSDDPDLASALRHGRPAPALRWELPIPPVPPPRRGRGRTGGAQEAGGGSSDQPAGPGRVAAASGPHVPLA
jgi:hypothetical protein